MNTASLIPVALLAIFACAVLVLVAAIVLLVRGWRGRRVDDDPHCRKCGYNLRGITSNSCPECGLTVSVKTVVWGQRRRRHAELAMGFMLLLIVGYGLGWFATGRAVRINWYLYSPTQWLIGMATDDDAEAIKELIRRTKAGALTATEHGLLAEAALHEHGAEPTPADLHKWADVVTVLDMNNALTVEQQDRFYRRLAHVELIVRPTIVQGDSLVEMIRVRSYGRHTPYGRFKMRIENRYVDGRINTPNALKEWHDVQLMGPGLGSSKSWPFMGLREERRLLLDSNSRDLRPGLHTFEYVLTQAVFPIGTDPEATEPIWSQEIRTKADVKVLGNTDPDPITTVPDTQLGEWLHSAIRIRSVRRRFLGTDRRERVTFDFVLDRSAPLCLCFDVEATVDGQEHELRMLTWSTGDWGSADSMTIWLDDVGDPQTPRELSVILRSSREAASRTIDCFQIWDGELRFGPIPIRVDQPRIRQVPPTGDQGEPGVDES